jgi:hypothetical protein
MESVENGDAAGDLLSRTKVLRQVVNAQAERGHRAETRAPGGKSQAHHEAIRRLTR